MRRRRRAASALLAAALAALVLTGAASAKSFTLPAADVSVQVTKDGSLVVDELITYSFSGAFSGGYRDIPLRKGESIDHVQVSEAGRAYRPGGCTELGCADRPARSGRHGERHVRVVWHYQAQDETRTFRIRYRLSGVAVAYDDVVDVNLQVWGSEWKEPLGRLTATRDAPGKILRPGDTPSTCAATSQLAGRQARPAGPGRAGGAVRRAPHRDPARRVHLDGRDAGRLGEGARRRSSPRRRPTRPRSSATTTGSRTRSSTRGGTRSSLLLLGTIPAFSSSRRCSGSGAAS